ncbi:MAG: hypothetical protein PARBA_03041 [Parabacteroides sp.]
MKTKIGMMMVGLALLASCSQDNENPVASAEGRITLGVASGDGGSLTRGVVNNLAALSADGANVGVYGVQTANTDAVASTLADWIAAPKMHNVKTTAINTQGIMSWANPDNYFYPKGEAKNNVRFFAYYPVAAATVTTPAGAGVSEKLGFTLTGDEDVMWATPVIGSRTQPASMLAFRHKLTQFTFVLTDNDGKFNSTYGAVTDLSVTANTKATMDMETGEMSSWNTEAALDVCKDQSITLEQSVPVALDKVLMLEPGKTSFGVTLKAAGTGGGTVTKNTDIKPVGDTAFEAGKHYVITLSVSGNTLIQLGASVEEWLEGGAGTGYIE